MTTPFEEWLYGEKCLSDLQRCARQIIERAEKLSLQIEDGYLEKIEYRNAVANRLWQFIRENAESIAERATSLLLSGDGTSFIPFIVNAFISHCLDVRRTYSPFHAYYRHMRAVLSKEKSVRYADFSKKSYYSYSYEKLLEILPERFRSYDFSTWTRPDIPFCEIHKKPAMLRLSRHFWDESLKLILAEYFLPIRDLVYFTASTYPLIFSITNESDGDPSETDDETAFRIGDQLVGTMPNEIDDSWKRQLPILSLDIIDTQLETLATSCAARLNDIQKKIFCLMDEGFIQDEIAAKLGMKRASNLQHYLKSARNTVKQFWSLWGSVPLEHFHEVHEEEEYLFYEKVLEICKKDIERRNSTSGASS